MREGSRMPLLLTEQQNALLEEALAESLAPSRSLFITEAINAGLANAQSPPIRAKRRRRRIEVWLPSPARRQIRELASACRVSQQDAVIHFLLEYIRAARWKDNQTIAEEAGSS
jgi:hypothetical protein